MLVVDTKYCGNCKVKKDVACFSKDSRTKSGLRSYCKSCIKNINRGKKGKLSSIYDKQVRVSKLRRHKPPAYSKQEFINWGISKPLYHKLHEQWEAAGYPTDLAPSCDRINDYKPYTLDNIQIMIWDENKRKYYNDVRTLVNNKTRKKVIQVDMITGKTLATYNSIKEASAALGVSHISECCKGKRKSIGGFIWKYKKVKDRP